MSLRGDELVHQKALLQCTSYEFTTTVNSTSAPPKTTAVALRVAVASWTRARAVWSVGGAYVAAENYNGEQQAFSPRSGTISNK
jgi:hypothetical protein